MIVRVLGEGRFEVPEPSIPALDRLYRDLVISIRADDDAAFRLALPSLLTEIRHRGAALPPGRLGVFDVLVPGKDCTLGDAHVLLQVVTSLRTGVIPG